MDWTDDGIVLTARRHGESSARVTLLTRDHGRHAGLVRNAHGPALRGVLEPGNRVRAGWRGRLAEHLGTFSLEPTLAVAGRLFDDARRLTALGAACAMAETCLPERAPHPAAFEGMALWLDLLAGDGPWPGAYVKWERGLLADLGFGLDLDTCAATGTTGNLVYVSPKSGRAVSARAGAPYRDRLLPLPAFLLVEGAPGDPPQVAAGLRLTGYFLERHVLGGQPLPEARRRLAMLFPAR